MKPTCALCGARKAKRACPGVARDICPACCGTKRLVAIACPSECPYLSAARTHPAAVVQRQQDRDLRFLLPRIRDLSEAQYHLFLFVQAVVLQHVRQAVPAPLDADVADAAAAVAATLETAGKGIIYAHHATTVPAERLAAEITRAVADVARRAGADAGRVERDTAMALRRLEGVARDAQAEVPDQSQAGPASSWIALATRVTCAAAAQGPPPEADKPRIVL